MAKSIFLAVLAVLAGAAVALLINQTSAQDNPHPHPNRADALNCVVNRELRSMDPMSSWLPENGYRLSDCPNG